MRRFAAFAAAASLLAAPALGAPVCASQADQAAFEVQALRTQFMVLATGCGTRAQYNAVVKRFQADLQANERAVNAYFQHRYGHAAQFEHDKFVTDLANAESRAGSDLGGDFCPRNSLVFDEALALETTAQLPDFAAGKNLVPASIELCAPDKPAPPRKAAAVAKPAKK